MHANDPQSAVRVPALDELLRIYLPALRAHLTRFMRVPPSEADDLIQNFVATKVLCADRPILGKADASRGRFRSFLLKAFRNFVVDEIRKRGAQKRGPGVGAVALPDDPDDMPGGEMGFDRAFHLEWVRQILGEALTRMEDECRACGRLDLWEVFDGRLAGPLLEGDDPIPYEELVRRCGCPSPARAMNLLVTSKRMFRRIIETVVRDTVEDEGDVEDELRALGGILKTGAGSDP